MTKMIEMLVPVTIVVTGLLLAEPAFAAVSVARAEVTGTRLRIEGTALASQDIIVDGVAMGRSDSSGQFEIRRDPYTAPPDCTVSLSDGSGTVTEARLSGCTVSNPPAPTDTTAPTAPTALSADLAGDTATLSWTASEDNVGVTGYRVSRNDDLLAGTVTGTTFTDPGLAAGTYTYAVRAVDAAGNVSLASNSASVTVQPAQPDNTPPSVPTDLTTTVVGTTINVGWSMSIDDTRVAGYTLTRNGQVRATTDTTSFTDSGLAPGTYTYTVTAFDAAGNTSAPSNPVSATVQAPEGLTFLTPAQLPDADLGQPYLAYIVASDPPGPSTFKFKLVSGRVPDGTRFLRNTLENRPEARVSGTPSVRGTFSFTVEVQDNTGATARRTFTITVL